MQRQRLDFNYTFAFVVKVMSVCTFLALAAGKDLEIKQMHVKMAYLHGQLEEDAYVEQPARYV